METISISRISLKGCMFSAVVDGDASPITTGVLEVVVVGSNPRLSKAWYAEAWNPDTDNTTPDCFTFDGLKPNSDSEQPQNDVCATCPQNSWGSRITPQGTRVKACTDKKRLAVVLADEPEGEVYLLEVTATALTGLNNYQKELTMRGIAPEIIKTAITFDTDVSFPRLKFSFSGYIKDETQPLVDKLFGSEQVKQITGEIPVRVSISPRKPSVASDFGFEDETGFIANQENLGGS